MNCNGNLKLFLFSVAVTAATVGFVAETSGYAQTPPAACRSYKRRVVWDSWQTLDKLPSSPLMLFEGTYKGTGTATGHTYLLHLQQYMNDQTSYTALVEDLDTGKAALGFLTKSKSAEMGVYDWFGIRVVQSNETQQLAELDIPLEDQPLFRFSIEQDAGGKIGKVTATNQNKDYALESVEYTKVRATLLTQELRSGKWASRKEELNLLSAETPPPASCATGPMRFGMQLRSIDSEHGSTLEKSFTARNEGLPGLFVVRDVVSDGYRRVVGRNITSVIVHTKAYDNSFLFFGSSRDDYTYIFNVDEKGFLVGSPSMYKFNN